VTISPDALPAGKVGVQSASEAYWQVSQRTPQERVAVYPTLRAALQALQNGEVASVAGDALVGAYIARDLSRVTYAGQLAPAHALGVAVSADDSKLSDAVRRQLDAMVADGVLEAIRSAWVGSLPKLVTPSLDASEALVP
jgi:ABC-type amino acid transport substrate-binding protein